MHCSIPALTPGSWQLQANDPNALTRLLDLPGMKVTTLQFNQTESTLHLTLEHTTQSACCPHCQQVSASTHQYRQRMVLDLPWAGKPCLLHLKTRRFWCQRCQRPFQEELPWLKKASRLTERYRQLIFQQCRATSVQAIHHQQNLGYKRVERAYYQKAREETQANGERLVRKLGIDEFAVKKGHDQFALAISDLEQGRIIAVLPDRKKETLQAYFARWTQQQRDAVEQVAMDLWEPYAQAVAKDLPQARIVADRFHVMKNLNDQVSRTRRDLQRSLPEESKATLKGCRWLLVRNEVDLSAEDKVKLTQMFEVAPELGVLHRLKEAFRDIFETQTQREQAAFCFQEWIASVESSGLCKLSKFVATLRHRWDHVLNYFVSRLSSGMVEGLNNKVKVVKRCGYGFGNFEHFSLRILVECDGT